MGQTIEHRKNTFLELHHITYSFENRTTPVLEDIHFKINDERIGLIGPNGAGKTTLLHIIMGLTQPQQGKVIFKGEPLTTEKTFHRLRREVGFLFQNVEDQLFSPTVLEDVAFGPLNLGLSVKAARQRAMETLNTLGLPGFENRITHMLSGGEKKMVALASILAMHPHLLLLDEPTNDLDPETRKRLIKILRTLNQPLLIISHDWDFLAQTTSTLYSLDKGLLSRCKEGHLHTHRHIHPSGDQPHHHQKE